MTSCNTTTGKITWILLLIGALNLGLIGIGNFLGFQGNVIGLLLGGMPVVENILYVLIGLSAVYCATKCK